MGTGTFCDFKTNVLGLKQIFHRDEDTHGVKNTSLLDIYAKQQKPG